MCWVGLLVALGMLAAASPAAAVVTFGSNLPEPTPGYYDSCSQTCTSAQLALPGATVRSPVDGTVVRFRLRTAAGSDAQTLRFRILRTSDGVNFTGAGTSDPVDIPTTAGTTEFPVNLPIRQGDYIGIDQPGGSKKAYVVARNTDAFQAAWFPALADGSTPRPSGNAQGSNPTLFDLLLQADVEPTPGPGPEPEPPPPPPPGSPPPTPLNCTSATFVATCADPNGSPSMCGPVTAGFPQCSLPFDLPTACSGTGTGLPTCALPGNYVVACGGFGMGLAVCNLPPLSVPQVCGPTTAGLPACAPANNQVLACGPTSVGLPACNFRTLIKAPKPIDINSGELDLVIGCPPEEEAGTPTARAAQSTTCRADVDLAALVRAKASSLVTAASMLGVAYLARTNSREPYRSEWDGDAAITAAGDANYMNFNQRVLRLIENYLEPGTPAQYLTVARLSPTEQSQIESALGLPNPGPPLAGAAPYSGPIDLWRNPFTHSANRDLAAMLVEANNEIYELQQRLPKKRRDTVPPTASTAGTTASPARPLFHKRVTLRRGKRGTRIRVRLSRRALRGLVGPSSRSRRAVAVRLVVSFRATPRPIVRFVDFRVPIRKRAR